MGCYVPRIAEYIVIVALIIPIFCNWEIAVKQANFIY